MPSLDFMPQTQALTSPTPLLLESMMYCSSSRGLAEVASHTSACNSVLCLEISDPVVPLSDSEDENAGLLIENARKLSGPP